jgi:3-phenylpropionate/trans-cinnamate dioxygenase ferredoxin subunit
MDDEFVKAADTEDVKPGSMTRVDVAGRRILLANVDGQFYATDDTCTHEDASLATGALHGALVTCPLHGSRFDLRTGEPQEEPADEALQTYAVRIDDGAIFVKVI